MATRPASGPRPRRTEWGDASLTAPRPSPWINEWKTTGMRGRQRPARSSRLQDGGGAVERLRVAGQPADEHRGAEHEQDVPMIEPMIDA